VDESGLVTAFGKLSMAFKQSTPLYSSLVVVVILRSQFYDVALSQLKAHNRPFRIQKNLDTPVEQNQDAGFMNHAMTNDRTRSLPRLGILGLLLGLIAMGLAVIPSGDVEGSVTLTIGVNRPELRINAIPNEKPTRWYTVASVCVALAGVGVAVLGYYRERIRSMAVCSLACCGMAILWPYILTGVAVGVGIIMVMILVWIIAGGS
jgi:hypothetical protein